MGEKKSGIDETILESYARRLKKFRIWVPR